MAPALINANPIVHEKKKRTSKPQANYNDAIPDVIDELEIFDILFHLLSSVLIDGICIICGFRSLKAAIIVVGLFRSFV